MSEARRVVVIGGGVAGLAAAYRLRNLTAIATSPEAGDEVAITLIESEARLGGKIVTERVDGFVIEGGPDSFLAHKPRGLGLCRELGLENRLRGTNETTRRTYVKWKDSLHELPDGLTGLVPTRFGPLMRSGLISPAGKLRMALDYIIPPRKGDRDETLAAFIERRVGREVYDRLIEPLTGGIYAGDGTRMSLAATFPQWRQAEREHGGLIRGLLAASRTSPAPNGRRPATARSPAFLTLASGLAELVEALMAGSRGVEIRLNARASRVDAAATGYTLTLASGASLHADAAILAAPAFAAAHLVAHLDSHLADALRAIPYVSTATVSVAYPLADVPRPLDGYGYVVPRAEGGPILACTWTSTKFPHRAPEGCALIRVFIGRAGQEPVLSGADDDLLRMARAELRATLGIGAPPIVHRVFRWPAAMPQYTVGHLERLTTIDERLAARPGLFVAGSAYRGVGIPDCIASGEQAADRALAHIRSHARSL